MRHRLLVRAVLCSALLLGSTGVAFAEPSPADIAQARELGGQAQAAFDSGNFAESEKLWTGAANLFPAPTLTLGLARTQVKLGKLVNAQESYNKIIREQGQNPNLSPAFKDALEAAKSEVGPISAKIANVVIRVEGPTNPTVTLDGQPVSNAGLGLKRPVDPGAHTVKAEAAGYNPAETKFDVGEAGSAEARLIMVKPGEGPPPPGVAAPAPALGGDSKPEGSKGSGKTLALAALGVGGAGIVLGSITGVLALGKHGDLEKACPDGKCSSKSSDDVDSYKTMGTLSTVGFIVGGVGLAAGAVLWFTATKGDSASTKSPTKNAVTWQPYVTAGGGGVTGRF